MTVRVPTEAALTLGSDESWSVSGEDGQTLAYAAQCGGVLVVCLGACARAIRK